jgi:hypothetical protein
MVLPYCITYSNAKIRRLQARARTEFTSDMSNCILEVLCLPMPARYNPWKTVGSRGGIRGPMFVILEGAGSG